MPRHGVGLNELLGGWDADGVEAQAHLPKAEEGEHERAPRTFSLTCQKWQHVKPGSLTKESANAEAGERNAHVNL